MLGKGFFLTESHNPDLPPEEWTEFYINTTAGAYQTSLPWGKYKIVISGAGGGGAACGWNTAHGTRYGENGKRGEEKTLYVDVTYNNTLNINGIVGAGGEGGYARTEHTNINHGGYGGVGYTNGVDGSNELYYVFDIEGSASGGGGGGSTSVEWNSTVQEVAAGGNGGNARQSEYKIWGYGGSGGNGGTTTGTGASGGTGYGALSNSQLIGGTGTDGYVKIYQSNLKPEPI